MTQRRIYTMRLADYLTSLGFRYNKTVQDIKRPYCLNWLFDDTPELQVAIERYKEERRDGRE